MQPTFFSVHDGDDGGGGMKFKKSATTMVVQLNEAISQFILLLNSMADETVDLDAIVEAAKVSQIFVW